MQGLPARLQQRKRLPLISIYRDCNESTPAFIDERRLKAGERVPPLILIVLYNGARRWSAPTETAKLITLSPTSALWPWFKRAIVAPDLPSVFAPRR